MTELQEQNNSTFSANINGERVLFDNFDDLMKGVVIGNEAIQHKNQFEADVARIELIYQFSKHLKKIKNDDPDNYNILLNGILENFPEDELLEVAEASDAIYDVVSDVDKQQDFEELLANDTEWQNAIKYL